MRNLAPRAVTQISNEITAHVQSATAQCQPEGMSEASALELAVQQPGSAKVAARGYRRAHLTATKFQMLGRGDPKQIVRRVVLLMLGQISKWLTVFVNHFRVTRVETRESCTRW